MESSPNTHERPFRMCPGCGRLTPTHLPRCVECGEPSVQAMAEAVEREDEQRFARAFFTRGTPATWALIGANVAVFVLMAYVARSVDPDTDSYTQALVNFGAKVNVLIDRGEYWRFVTPAFIHIGPMHLLVNMYSLYVIGPQVERLYGTARFLILYLVSGVAGVLGSYYMSPNMGVSAGASGALFGLLGVLFVFGLRFRGELPGMFRQAFSPRGLVPVLVLNLFITFALSFIDKWAHLGGLFAGAALAAVVPYFRSTETRAGVLWRIVATVCVLATVACFVLAFRAPKLTADEANALLGASQRQPGTGSDNGQFIGALNTANTSLDEVAEALARASQKRAILPAVADRARAAAADVRAAKGFDARSRELLGREADLLESGANSLSGAAPAVDNASVESFLKDRKTLFDDWKAWVDAEGPKYGLVFRDKEDNPSGGEDGN